MNHELALAAIKLLTRLFEALDALLELVRHSRGACDEGKEARKRPRHLKK